MRGVGFPQSRLIYTETKWICNETTINAVFYIVEESTVVIHSTLQQMSKRGNEYSFMNTSVLVVQESKQLKLDT